MKINCFYASFILMRKLFRGKRVAFCSVPDDIESVILILYDMDYFDNRMRIIISNVMVFESGYEESVDKIRDIREIKNSSTVLFHSNFVSKFISSFVDYFIRREFEVCVPEWITVWFSLLYVVTKYTRSELNNGILIRRLGGRS